MLLYIWYPVLLCVLFWNARIEKKGSWNDGFLSLGQTKALLGFCTLGVVFHHLSQNLAWRTWPITQLGFFFDSGVYWVGLFLFCSGYGVYKSYLTKPGYLHGFVMHRVVKKILIPFYLTTLIYIIVMFAAGMHIGFPDILWYATGVRLANRNAWYVIAIVLFYLAFYFSFAYCPDKRVSFILTALFVAAYMAAGVGKKHGPENFWLEGEWWYNTAHLFVAGMLVAKYEDRIVPAVKHRYVIFIAASAVLTAALMYASARVLADVSYYQEYSPNGGTGLKGRLICLAVQSLTVLSCVCTVMMIGLKVRIGNRVLSFFGSISLELYLMQGLFVTYFGVRFFNHRGFFIKNGMVYTLVVLACATATAVIVHRLDNGTLFHRSRIQKS